MHVHGHERRPIINVVSLRNLSWMNKEKKMAQTQSDENNDESNQSQDNYGIRKTNIMVDLLRKMLLLYIPKKYKT